MANSQHIKILRRGVESWNKWRIKNPKVTANLRNLDLSGEYLRNIDFRNADLRAIRLRNANLSGAILTHANLNGADLSGANLRGAYGFGASLRRTLLQNTILNRTDFAETDCLNADFSEARIRQSNFREAFLVRSNFSGAAVETTNFMSATLNGSNFSRSSLLEIQFTNSSLVDVNLNGALIKDCHIFGISAWNLQLHGSTQLGLVITSRNEPTVTVDNLEVAQFIHLLLHNETIRGIIDTLTSKVVLILGRFSDKRKVVLKAIKEELRRRNYTPVLFDFEKPASRNITETVRILASMSRFVIADLTDPRSIPHELMAFVEHYPSVPVQPILLSTEREYGMFEHFTHYSWVLPIQFYDDQNTLLASLRNTVISPAEAKAQELQKR